MDNYFEQLEYQAEMTVESPIKKRKRQTDDLYIEDLERTYETLKDALPSTAGYSIVIGYVKKCDS
jgi:hypothetical protein